MSDMTRGAFGYKSLLSQFNLHALRVHLFKPIMKIRPKHFAFVFRKKPDRGSNV